MARRARGSSSAGVDRNALERDRRLYMKQLFSRLSFLLPSLASKRSISELLDQAVTHVRQLGEKVEMLKQKKKVLLLGSGTSTSTSTSGTTTDHHDHNQDQTRGMISSCSTVLTVSYVESMLEVCVKSGSNKRFMLNQIIEVLVEEAAQVVAVSYSNVGGIFFYIIKAQAVSPRIGIETSTVHERLKELIF